MRKKFFAGKIVKEVAKKTVKKISPKFRDAIKKHKKLLDKYKSKPLDKEAVRESYKIFTKPPGPRR